MDTVISTQADSVMYSWAVMDTVISIQAGSVMYSWAVMALPLVLASVGFSVYKAAL